MGKWAEVHDRFFYFPANDFVFALQVGVHDAGAALLDHQHRALDEHPARDRVEES